MGIEVRLYGNKCNLACTYCYQENSRAVESVRGRPQIETIKAEISKQNQNFTLFGGEPLVAPIEELEDLWHWGFEKFGSNGLQTNGTLLKPEHVELIKKYNVYVGVSMDGPDSLNMTRWIESPGRTLELTEKSQQAIELLLSEGVGVGLIVTLSKTNATADKLPIMHEWFRYLDALGLRSARLHLLEVENVETGYALGLSDEENIRALWSFYELEDSLQQLRFDVTKDMTELLLGQDNTATCVWRGCDHLNTTAVYGIERDGTLSNCGRVYKDGVEYRKSDDLGYERYLGLYHTPEEAGGCGGCRFFLMCKGWCPGTSPDGDWRSKTSYCEVWKELFAKLECQMIARGVTPISTDAKRRRLENIITNGWRRGANFTMNEVLPFLKDAELSDGEIISQLISNSALCNGTSHGDRAHGDHTDSVAMS